MAGKAKTDAASAKQQPKDKQSNKAKSESSKQSCPIQEALEKLVVYDEEASGPRYFDKKSCTLEIVQTGKSDKVILHYTGPNPPKELAVSKDGVAGKPLKAGSRGGGAYFEFEASYEPDKDPYDTRAANILSRLFTHKCPPVVYTLSGFASPVKIKTYNPDQWKLIISLPPFKSMKMGVKLDNSSSASIKSGSREICREYKESKTLTINKSYQNWETSTEQSLEASYQRYCQQITTPDMYQLTRGTKQSIQYKSETKASKVAINLQLNARGVEVDGQQLVQGILQLVSNLTAAVKAFRDTVPKIGWYIDFNIKALEGSLEVAWGWREDKDHLVFYYLGAAAKVTIFEIMLELGFGVSVAGIAGQVCVQFKGGVSFQLNLVQTVGRAADSATLGELVGTIEAGGYIRFKAGELIQIEGGINSSITLKSKVDVKFKEGLSLDGESQWDGLNVVVTAKTFFATKKKKWPLVAPQKMGEFKFPKGKLSPPSEYKSIMQVSSSAEKAITKGLNLRVFKESTVQKKHFLTREVYQGKDYYQLESKEVADMVASAIWRHRDELVLDAKTTDGICHSIRKDCDIIAARSYQRDWMKKRDLELYLQSQHFRKIINDAKDITKCYQKDLKKL